MQNTRRPASAFLIITCALLTGCTGGEKSALPGAERASEAVQDQGAAMSSKDTRVTSDLPPGHPPTGTEPGEPLPLKPTGIGSQQEMDRALAQLDSEADKKLFELAFRQSFTSVMGQRDYMSAKPAMETFILKHPEFAPAYRVLAYATFNVAFDLEGGTNWYRKAVELDPDYGEAHYALSFMLTQFDLEEGRMHFEKAMELGVDDERNLGEKFYPARDG